MKNLCLFLLLSSCISLPGIGQNIKGGIIFGGNMAQVDGDEVVGYKKIGFNVGACAILPLGERWSVSVETLFNQKGAYKKYPFNFDSTLTFDDIPYYNLRLNYLEVPVMVLFNDKDVVTGGLGFSWSRLVSGYEYEHGNLIPWTSKRGPYDTDDLSFLIDVRFRMYWKLWFNFRYNYSMFAIRERIFTTPNETWSRKQYNNYLSFRVLYIVNDKVPPKKVKQPKKKKEKS